MGQGCGVSHLSKKCAVVEQPLHITRIVIIMMFMKTERLETSFSRINDWIKAVDQKISIALVFEIGVLALIAKPTYGRITLEISGIGLKTETLILITAELLALSVLWAIFALKPHTGRKKEGSSLTFFGSIAGMSLTTFKNRMRSVTEAQYKTDLTEQIHINSGIAHKKHRLLSQSLTLFVIGMLFWLITMAVIGSSTHA